MRKPVRNFGLAKIQRHEDQPLQDDFAGVLTDPGQSRATTSSAEDELSQRILQERIRGLEALLEEKERALKECREREMRLLSQGMAAPKPIERRVCQRYPVDWKAALVSDEMAQQQIFYGRVSEVSLDGMSFLCDQNIFSGDDDGMLSIPPLVSGGKEKIIEVGGRMTYTVLAASIQQFRVGVQFAVFKGDGQIALRDYLEPVKILCNCHV